jgi:hypothetical protein
VSLIASRTRARYAAPKRQLLANCKRQETMAIDPKRVQAVFQAALAAPSPAARATLLDRECGVDDELRQRVVALL